MSNTIAQFESTEETRSVLDSPAEFSGFSGDTLNMKAIKEVRIGLLFPEDSLNSSGNQLINAANMAISEINRRGGYRGIPYRLINRWSSNPWGAGSKELIKLIYNDSVFVVIGSINGEMTHIAEQITTKAWVPLVSPISADPTLNYVRIPWIYRLPPDYKSQSEIIVSQIIKSRSVRNIGLIVENSHDGQVFFNELSEVLSYNNIYPIFHFHVVKKDLDIQAIVSRVISFNASSIIVCLSKDNIVELLAALNAKKQELNVFVPWIPGLDYDIMAQYYTGDVYYIEPFVRTPNKAYAKFACEYYKHFGIKPTFASAYMYDAVYIIYSALQKSGLNRIRLREAISTLKDFQGVTGKISWDNGGSNIVQPVNRSLSGGLNE